jgi:hypothetical protein
MMFSLWLLRLGIALRLVTMSNAERIRGQSPSEVVDEGVEALSVA